MVGEFDKAENIRKGDVVNIGGVWCNCLNVFPANSDTVVIQFKYTSPIGRREGHLVVANDFPIQKTKE